MSAMVIPTARVSGVRRGSAADRARQAWFAGSAGPHAAGVPTPRRARPTAVPARAAGPARPVRTVAGATAGSTPRPVRARSEVEPHGGQDRRPARPAHGGPVGSAQERPLRLTRRGRLVVLMLGMLVLAGGVQGGQALADGPSRALEVVSHTVAAGETLWEIASTQARPGEDVRDVVLELQSLNGLRSAGLAAGQQILLPVER
jgi:hypothetical protein